MFSSGILSETNQHTKPVVDLKWNCDGSYLGSASYDKTVKLYLLESSGALKVMHTVTCAMAPNGLCWHPTNPTRFAILTDEKNIEIWDVKASSASAKLISLGSNINASWSPNGKYLAVGNKTDNITVLEVATGKQLKKFKFNYEVNEFAWSALSDHLLLATGSPEGGTVDILSFSSTNNTASLTLVDSLPAHTSSCFCLKVDPSGSFMAVGSADFLISIWDLREGCVCVRTITAFDAPIRCMSFSVTGEYLVAASDSNQVLICNTLTGELVSAIEMKTNVNALSWNSYKNMIATGHDNKALASAPADSRGGGTTADSISSGGMGGGGGVEKSCMCTLVDADRGNKKMSGAPAFVKLISFEHK